MNIRRMTLEDVSQVSEIERASFANPWSENSFRNELIGNEHSFLFVAEDADAGQIIGLLGYWFIIDECHISTIAVHHDWRRKGVGQSLLSAALSHAVKQGALTATLEVRLTNVAAIGLYQKFGFKTVGARKHYYRDNGEDALIMTAEPIQLLTD